MRNLKFLVICFFLSISIGHAQQKQAGGMRDGDPTARAKSTVEKLHKELNLTQIQQDSIYNYIIQKSNLRKAQASKSKEAVDKPRTDREDMREQHNTKIKSFLTKEQIEKFDAVEKQQNTRRAQRAK